MKRAYVYTDGGARGNPGHSAIGIVIVNEDEEIIETYKEYIGKGTNNEAEYKALIKALQLAKKHSKKIHCYSDSELLIKQILGEYKIRKQHLQKLFEQVEKEEENYQEVTYSNVRRENEFIQKADSLVNQALDEKIK